MNRAWFTLAGIALMASPSVSIASDKSEHDAFTTAFETVHFFYACRAHLGPQALSDAEARVPSILTAGGFTDVQASLLAPKTISAAKVVELTDQYQNAISCENEKQVMDEQLGNWMKQLEAER